MKAKDDAETSIRRLYLRVSETMEKEQLFLDQELSLNKLARLVGTNRTDLSKALNSHAKINFSKWLATYRINYIIRQMQMHPKKSIEQLYPVSGFSSRTSCFRQFKEITGKSPRELEPKKIGIPPTFSTLTRKQ